MKAKQRGREVTQRDLFNIDAALARLKDARDALRAAGCSNAANYVQRALKSAEGAKNNADRMFNRQERAS